MYISKKQTYISAHFVIYVLLLSTVVSCSRFSPDRIGPGGLQASVEQLNYGSVSTRQNELVAQLKSMAGLVGDIPPLDAQWFLVLKAGMVLVDGQCEQYLDALFRFNREQRAIQQGLTATAATTAAILGLTGASGTAVGITAAALGLGSVLFEAVSNTVLFQLEPSAVRNIVRQASDAYKTAVFSQEHVYQSRPDAMLGLQGYLALCTPAAIEARVNEAAIESTFKRREGDVNNPSPNLRRIDKSEFGISQQKLRDIEERLQAFEASKPPTAPTIAPPVPGARGPVEEALSREQLERIRSALCIPQDGGFGDDFRATLGEYRAGLASRVLTDAERNALRSPPLSVSERESLQSLGSCQTSGFLSAFERALLRESFRAERLADDQIEPAAVIRLQPWVRRLMGAQAPTLTTSIPTLEVREAIESKRRDLGITTGAKGSITAELWRRVLVLR